MVLGPLVPH